MEAGTRVFSDAKQCSPSGCKKLGKHGSRKGAVRRSAHLITDYKGDEYERVEYTPYGEYWIEKRAPENKTLPFKFTGKERDEETGLYYYGARYLDAKTSRWLTTDPALGEYIPMAPVNDEAKKHNQNLPGMGGIYNTVNFHLYHYAGNNPVKYTDQDGRYLVMSNFNKSNNRIEYSIGFYNMMTKASRMLSNIIPFGTLIASMQNAIFNFENMVKGTHSYIEYDSDANINGMSLAVNILQQAPAGKLSDILQAFDKMLAIQGGLESLMANFTEFHIKNFLDAVSINVLHDIDNKEDAVALSQAIVAGIAVYKNKRLDRYFSQTDWVKAIRDYFFCRNDTDYFKLYNEVMAGTYD